MSEQTSLQAVFDSAAAVKTYAGSELSRHLDEMLMALANTYRDDLAEVDESGLRVLQAKLRQALAIRDVVIGRSQSPRT